EQHRGVHRRADLHRAEGRHAVAHRPAVLRQGGRMEPDLRGQSRPARQSRPDPARPGAEGPAAGRLTARDALPFPSRRHSMTRKTLNIAIAAGLLGTLALAGCKKDQDETAMTPP